MFAKGNLHANGVKLVRYILSAEPGERVEQAGSHGFDFFSEDPVEAARLMQRMADVTTRCEKAWFHTQTRLPPGEALTPEQWETVRTREEKRLGFTGLPCIWSFHIDEASGERHLHAAWFRVDVEQERAVDPGLFKLRLKELCRALEKEFALREVSNHREAHDRASVAGRNEAEEARRLGTDVRAIRSTILDCYERSDSGKAFKAALEAQGLVLANGDRRDCFVVIDEAGGHHALNKKLTGQTLAATRNRLSDLDRAQLPCVDQAKVIQAELQAARGEPAVAPVFDRDAANEVWMEKVEAAAIAKETATRTAHDGHQPGRTDAGETPDAAARGPYAVLQPEDPGPETKVERPLGKIAGAIRTAWSLSRSATELEEALAVHGISLAQVDPEEAYASERRAAFAKATGHFRPAWREGEIVAVDGRGTVYRLNERTTGDMRAEIEGRLAGVDRATLMNVADTKGAMRAAQLETWKSERQAERERARPASWIEHRIAECAELARISGAAIQQDAAGNCLSRVEALADRLSIDAVRHTVATTVHGPEAFAARLDDAGIAIVRVTAADVRALDTLRHDEDMERLAAETNREAYSGKHFATLLMGDLAAVTRHGDVYRINPDKLGDARHHIAIDLPSVTEARARFEIEREQTAGTWDQHRADASAARQERNAEHEQWAARSRETAAPTLDNEGMRSPEASGGRLLAGLANAVAAALSGVFEFLVGGPPKLTAQQVEGRAKAESNLETQHARNAAAEMRSNDADRHWRRVTEKSRPQEQDLNFVERFGRPPSSREVDRERGRERD